MHVFVYEHFTGNGIGREPGSPEHGISCEGRAMRDAVTEDLTRIEGVTVGECSSPCWLLIIAPETDSILAGLAEAAVRAGKRLLGPSPEAIRLTSDKLRLAEHWREYGIPTPATTDREPTACEMFPVVWKPRDGAGSTATFRLNAALDVTRAKAQREAEGHRGPMILQEFVSGQPASLAFLCGPAGNTPLFPAAQLLSEDGRFQYRGGEIPLTSQLAMRAVQLGQRAADCVPGLLGYVGVDLVLGDAADGSRDYVIEINPRLTTSYVGLRALAAFNLAAAMLQSARGELLAPLLWKSGQIRFAADGSVTQI